MREPIETLGRRVKWKWLGRLEKEEGLERERDRDFKGSGCGLVVGVS